MNRVGVVVRIHPAPVPAVDVPQRARQVRQHVKIARLRRFQQIGEILAQKRVQRRRVHLPKIDLRVWEIVPRHPDGMHRPQHHVELRAAQYFGRSVRVPDRFADFNPGARAHRSRFRRGRGRISGQIQPVALGNVAMVGHGESGQPVRRSGGRHVRNRAARIVRMVRMRVQIVQRGRVNGDDRAVGLHNVRRKRRRAGKVRFRADQPQPKLRVPAHQRRIFRVGARRFYPMRRRAVQRQPHRQIFARQKCPQRAQGIFRHRAVVVDRDGGQRLPGFGGERHRLGRDRHRRARFLQQIEEFCAEIRRFLPDFVVDFQPNPHVPRPGQHVAEPRNPLAAEPRVVRDAEVQPRRFGIRQRRQPRFRRERCAVQAGGAVDGAVVQHDEFAVAGAVQVQLDHVVALGGGAPEGGHGIFRALTRRAAVRFQPDA